MDHQKQTFMEYEKETNSIEALNGTNMYYHFKILL